MKPKTETKDPSTLDSLLKCKEQTDKALAELADSLREKLRKLEAVVSPTLQTAKPQSKAFDAFEVQIGKQFWTWFWRIVAFVVMSVLIWGTLALLKEPKANGTANVCLPSINEHPGEPVDSFSHSVSTSIVIPMTADEDEPVSPDILPSLPTATEPVIIQRTRFFQRRP